MGSIKGNQVEVGTLVVKIASRCNLACDYCYIYSSKDTSWMEMPKKFPADLVDHLVNRINELYQCQETKPNIVLHGGEPLLAGINFIKNLVEKIRRVIPEAKISIQSNGTIYNANLAEILRENNVYLSFSVDGFQRHNDRHRLSIKGVSAYKKIEKNIAQALLDKTLSNILLVIDFANDPEEIFEYMQSCGVEDVNLILPDGDYNSLPFDSCFNKGLTKEWLWSLFKLYASSENNIKVRFFDDITRMLVKKNRGLKSPPSTYSLCTLTVDTDGTIKQSDTFRINDARADFIGDENIASSSIVGVANSLQNIDYLRRVETLSDECKRCEYLDVCGGGYPSHRLRGNSYKNPSIYCSDYKYLFKNIESAVCNVQPK